MDARKEWLDQDYYAELGVNASATDDEITKAYRGLARKLHPDKNPGDTESEERFKRVTAAYDVLGDSENRKKYDEVRRYGAQGGGGQRYKFDYDSGDLDDLLGGMFRSQGPFSGQGRSGGHTFSDFGGRPMARRGADDKSRLRLSFAEAVEGFTTNVTLSDGSSSREIKIRVPAGVRDAQTLRLPGKGARGQNGGPDGDLLVTVSVDKHTIFDRTGNDLTIELPITYAEAVLGATVPVPVFGGGSVKLRIPAGTPSGKKFRVKGKGVVTARSTGNLLVTVYVSVPAELNESETDALRSYSDLVDEQPRSNFEEG